jgi:predicted RNA-binding Zn ribbon-like protein
VTFDISGLPLLGGHPALDLVNTVTPRVPTRGLVPEDHLTDPGALLVWAGRAGVTDEREANAVGRAWRREAGAGEAALEATREVREALHAVLLDVAGMEPSAPGPTAAALRRLHDRWAAAMGRATLVPDRGPGPGAVGLDIGVAPALLIPDRVAAAAVDLLRTVDVARLRRCPPHEGGCGWIVLDNSRNGSRRWCRMADCGSEVKARRLTERRRAARARPAPLATSKR